MSYMDFDDYSTTSCPYCGNPKCYADWCDVGVGYVQCGPFHCEDCLASEIGPYDDKSRTLSKQEQRTGWYAPGAEPGSSANVVNGKIVSSKEMENLYYNSFENNPLYHKEGYVEEWFRETRRKKNE